MQILSVVLFLYSCSTLQSYPKIGYPYCRKLMNERACGVYFIIPISCDDSKCKVKGITPFGKYVGFIDKKVLQENYKEFIK